ncbi:MAG: tRNA (N(6)-L-threonylcarbamoyladenosine(37)-C(2))-methylthiotransferase MtaB [Ichthyobacteriaceae bacterium]|nr:tRNA (N(6)-L-threonylcarbamoyladenosine(37)-C(2))-methylthiotransferase MtaB [Ichthyobacteriaceae bacterium]
MDNKKVAFYTLGCKLNFSETSTISRQFINKGYDKVEFNEPADIYVINTCSVTENADKRFKTTVKTALKTNPKAFIIAIGCYAQLKPEELADLNGVDLVLGATEKFKITNYINDLSKKEFAEVHSCEIEDVNIYEGSYSVGDRTRAFLKIQDGCDYKCTYCTIPLARGISRSDTLDNVIKNAKEITAKGIKEIVITGINTGDYGKGENGDKKHQHTFLDLVKKLDEIENLARVRISSIEPNLLKNETIEFVSKSNSFVPHFHIPLQSGNDEILGLMKRRYKRDLYTNRVEQIKILMPDAAIGVDVIVGFPGETDEYFMDTFKYLKQLDVAYFHVFTYSERDNTEAVLMDNVVPMAVRNKRSKMLRGLSVKKKRAFYESQIGKQKTVIFEADNKNGFMHGFTENYVKVKTKFNSNLINQEKEVELVEIDEDGDFIINIL